MPCCFSELQPKIVLLWMHQNCLCLNQTEHPKSQYLSRIQKQDIPLPKSFLVTQSGKHTVKFDVSQIAVPVITFKRLSVGGGGDNISLSVIAWWLEPSPRQREAGAWFPFLPVNFSSCVQVCLRSQTLTSKLRSCAGHHHSYNIIVKEVAGEVE